MGICNILDSPLVGPIVKFLKIINCFTALEVELNAAEIQNKSGVPKTTLYRMLSAMTQAGLLEKNSETSKYGPGPTLFHAGMLYLNRTNIVRAATDVIKAMNDITLENVNVVIFDKDKIIMIMKEEAKYDFRLASHIGTSIPAHSCATGKAFLSEMTTEEIDGIYPSEYLPNITKKTIATKTLLKKDLEQIRKTGISIDKEGAFDGIEGIAVLVRDATKKPVAAISMTIPIFRMNQVKQEKLGEFIKLGASLISYRLGYYDHNKPKPNLEDLRILWEQN